MTLLWTLIGTTLIFAVFRDVFHTLFSYAGKLTVSSLLAKAFWRGLHRLKVRRPMLLYAAGPVAFIATMSGWFILLALGWSLVYWPHMPSAFAFGEELDATARGGFDDALYFSLGTQATLGCGDIVPTNPWLMMGATLQAMSGLGILLATLSWYLAIGQARSQCRSLAHRINLLIEAEPYAQVAVTRVKPEATRLLLDDFATQLLAVRGEFLRFPITYYYGTNDERSSLPGVLPYLVWLAEEGGREDCPPEVRLYAATLHGAIDHFSATIATRFLDIAPSPQVLQEYSRDHLCERHPGDDARIP